MALLEKDTFEEYMGQLLVRFDYQDKILRTLINKQPKLLDGEALLDNQDLCQLLQVSKRTLQRYRSSKTLPYHRLYNKTYYKESEVNEFIRTHFEKHENKRL